MSHRPTVVALLAAALVVVALLAAAPARAASPDYSTDCPMIPQCYTCLAKYPDQDNSSYYCSDCDAGYTLNINATSANGYCLCGVQYCSVCTTDGSGKCATNGCIAHTTYKDGACIANDRAAGLVSVVGAAAVTLLLMFAF